MAADGVEIKLHGFEEARRALLAMPDRIQKNVLRGTVLAVARQAREDARARAPRDTGNLLRNVIARTRRGSRGETKSSVMVNQAGKRDSGRNAFYWRFLEFGTVKMAARPFLRPAFDALAAKLDSIVAGYMRTRVHKELAKLAGMPKK